MNITRIKSIAIMAFAFIFTLNTNAQMINLKCDFVKDADTSNGVTIYGPQVQQGEILIGVTPKGDTTYILLLKYYGKEELKGTTGFSVVFEDGLKINYPKEVINLFKPKDGSSNFYHTKVRMKRKDIALYSQQKIKQYTLVNQKITMPVESAERFRKNIECFLKNY